jgi:hypothetical protein
VIARTLLIALALSGVARAQDDVDDEEPPSAAARETPTPAAEPAPAIVAPAPRRRPGRVVGAIEVLPGYRRALGSDWLGSAAEASVGGEAKNGFAALLRVGVFAGATTYQVPFQHWTLSAVFLIPTGTRFHLGLGHTFGVVVLQLPHTIGGNAASPTMGGFVAPSIDLWSHAGHRVSLEARLSYDYLEVNHAGNDAHAVTTQLGVSYLF